MSQSPREALVLAFQKPEGKTPDQEDPSGDALDAAIDDMWDAVKADDRQLFRSAVGDLIDIELTRRG